MTDFVKAKIINFTDHSRAVNISLLAFLVMGVALYIFFANVAVRTLSASENLKSEAEALSLKVSEMEGKRLSIDNTVGSTLARDMGFVEVREQTFIVNKPKGGLSLKVD